MRHPRRKYKGYTGPRATPWKYRVGGPDGLLIHRGWTYHVRLLNRELGSVLWEGEVVA